MLIHLFRVGFSAKEITVLLSAISTRPYEILSGQVAKVKYFEDALWWKIKLSIFTLDIPVYNVKYRN